RLLQLFFHACPTLTRGFLRSTPATPVRLKAGRVFITLLLERLELPGPVDESATHRCPLLARTIWLVLNVLAMNVADTVLRQGIVPIRECLLAAHRSIARIPIDHEILRLHGGQQTASFCASSCVAGKLVFENQDDLFLRSFVGCIAHFVVNRGAVGSLIVKPPKIKDTYAIGVEGFGQFERALQELVLLLEGE